MLIRSLLRWAVVAPVVLLFAGCASVTPNYEGPRTQERYRLFFSRDANPQISVNEPVEQIAAHFAPEQAVTTTLENYRKDGFQLVEIRNIGWMEGATLFVFSRELGPNEVVTRPPIGYLGSYAVEGDPRTRFVFEQLHDSYVIHQVGPEGVRSFKAFWEGRELVWTSETGEHRAQLSPDGQELFLVTENPDNPQALGVAVKARRVVPQQLPADVITRRSYAYLGKTFRPATPRYYDPFPW